MNIEMRIAGLEESVTVTGESPVVDTQATKMTTSFDAEMLASMPSARDQWAILAESPAVRLSRIDVGGSASGTQTGFSVYGTSGQNRPLVEGINSTEGTGDFGNYVDYGSFDEVAVATGAHGADMAVPGVQMQFISKSGEEMRITGRSSPTTRARTGRRSTSTRIRSRAASRAAADCSRKM